MCAPAARRMIVPGPARGRVDLEADAAAQALPRGDSNRFRRFWLRRRCVLGKHQTLRACSPDGAKRNPGIERDARPRFSRSLSSGVHSSLLHLVMNGVIGIAGLLAAIERRPVIRRQRKSVPQAARLEW